MSSITNPCRQGYVSIRYSNSTHTVTGSLMSTGNMAPDTKENILLLKRTMAISPKDILRKGIRSITKGSVTNWEISPNPSFSKRGIIPHENNRNSVYLFGTRRGALQDKWSQSLFIYIYLEWQRKQSYNWNATTP